MKKVLLLTAAFAVVSHALSQQAIKTRITYGFPQEKNNMLPQKPVKDTLSAFTVDGTVALHSLVSISDAHMLKLADALKVLANTDAVRSGSWDRIHNSFAEVAHMNVPAVYWFAHPDGSYWTLDQGKITAKLSDREYFPHLMAGQPVLGQLVVSHSTNRNTAIVAVPVYNRDNAVIGALGCSVYLDSLSALIRKEMGGLEEKLFFFSFDAKPLVALHADPSIIFIEPMKQEDPGLKEAFSKMLSGTEGVVQYIFRNVNRTVLYYKSPVTNWWYAFGRMEP
jgi:hypothetical protein